MGKTPNPKELRHSFATAMQLTRPWSLTEFLFTLIPVFSLLFAANIVTSPALVISLTVPFLFLFAAGFIYNSRCDVHVDSDDKNPIRRGVISKRKAILLMLAFLLVTIFSLLLFYTSIVVFLFFALHLLLGFLYNGLGLRLKESPLGVFIAGFGFYAAPPLYVLIQFNYFSPAALALLLFIFLTYTGREILHTLLDYEKDASKNCKTFAVRFGRTKAMVIMQILGLSGYLVILWEVIASGNFFLQVVSFIYGAVYLAIIAVEILTWKFLHNLGFLWVVGRWPFFLCRLYLLLFSLIFMELSPLVSLLAVWAFLTTKHY